MNSIKVAISQSNYIPWKGYFDNIARVDEFVLYDDMQYTKRDWRNRNKIKTNNGLKWLTIPVKVKGKYFQKIKDTEIIDQSWNDQHFQRLKQNYSNAKCYDEVIDRIEDLYSLATQPTISKVNHHFLVHICKFLNIDTNLSFSSDYNLKEDDKTKRLVDICLQLNATKYYSGEAAKSYMDESLFTNKQISVNYFNYSDYKEYDQLYGKFEHGVSILDLIFSEGKNAINFLKHT